MSRQFALPCNTQRFALAAKSCVTACVKLAACKTLAKLLKLSANGRRLRGARGPWSADYVRGASCEN